MVFVKASVASFAADVPAVVVTAVVAVAAAAIVED